MASRTQHGIYLGIKLTTGKSFVGNPNGVFKTRSIHRRPADQRRSYEQLVALKGTPWKPYQFNDSDKILVKMPDSTETEDDLRERA